MVLEEANFGFVETEFGPAPAGSQVTYQQSVLLADIHV